MAVVGSNSNTSLKNRASRIIVKPRFDHGGGGFLTQQNGQYTIYDPDGNQLEQINVNGRPGEHGIKVRSNSIAGGLPQGSVIEGPDGTRYTLSGGAGQRHEFDEGNPDPILVSNKGATGGGGYAGGTQSGGGFVGGTYTTAGGNNVVIPGGVDWNTLQFTPVDWERAMSQAGEAGVKAREAYFNNLKNSQQAGLDLVDTDVQGIMNAQDKLIPRVRQQGDQDQSTNIRRAGEIDAYNKSRLPGINSFNRGEISKTNDYNAEEYRSAVDSTGVNFRKRVTDVLDAYATEATGKFEDPLLDNLITSTSRSRGADIASSSGVGSLSGAGRNIQDLIDVDRRLQMADTAKARIPGVAGQAQQLLQPPVETAKTQLVTPTEVPLTQSNIADKMQIKADVSAGSAAKSIADTATSYEAIPATTALSTNLGTQQYNSAGQYTRDLQVLNGTQSQNTAAAGAVQGGFNADKGDQIRQADYEAYQQGLDTQSNNQLIGAGANILGTVGGAILSDKDLRDSIFGSSDPTSAASTADRAQESYGNYGGEAPSVESSDISAGSYGGVASSGAPYSLGGSVTTDPVSGQMIGGSSGGGPISVPVDSQSYEGASYGGIMSGGGGGYSPGFEGSTQLSGPPGANGGGVIGNGDAGYSWSPPTDSGSGGFDVPVDTGSYGIGEPQFARGSGVVRVGGTEISSDDYKATMDHIDNRFTSVSGKPVQAMTASQPNASGSGFLPNSPLPEAGMPNQAGLAEPYKVATGAVKNPTTGAALLNGAVASVSGWKEFSGSQKLAASGQQGVGVLAAKGFLDPQSAKVVGSSADALASLASTNLTSTERSSASGTIGSILAMRSFTGTVDSPTSIGNKRVVSETTTPDGHPGFRLEDGSFVSKGSVQATSDANASFKTYQTLMSTASDDKKIAALKTIGVQDAAATALLKKVGGGDSLAALSVFNTSADWNDQTPVHHAATIMQTTGMINGAMNRALPSNYKNTSKTGERAFKSFQVNDGKPTYNNGPLSVGPNGVQVNTSVGGNRVGLDPLTGNVSTDFYGIPVSMSPKGVPVPGQGGNSISGGGKEGQFSLSASGVRGNTSTSLGGDNKLNTGVALSPTGDVSVSPRVQIGSSPGSVKGSSYGGQAGAFAGSFFGPAGSLIGNLGGSFIGSITGGAFGGKPSGKDYRNAYRDNLVKNGFANKGKDGSVNIPLANGTAYNLGIEGGAQLKNKDGSQRFSYEVDWTNPTAADSIPSAQLAAIATGLDPTMTQKDSFNRLTGQLTNAFTSNASSVKDAQGNVKAFLSSKNISPDNIGMRVEALRATNKISDQEYKVYLNQLNQMYGTKYQPRDIESSRSSFIQMLSGQKLDKADKSFLEELQDEKRLSSNQKKTDKRVNSREVSDSGGLPTPERYRNDDSRYSMVA